MEERFNPPRWINWFLVLVFMGVFITPRLVSLGSYATADEPLYLKSSASYYYLLREKRFNETDLIIHPGIGNLWAGAAGFFAIFPEYASDERTEFPIADLHFRQIVRSSDHTPLEMLAIGRAATLLIQTLILGAALYFCIRVIGRWPAFIAFLLVSFDPFYFANSRILQPDGILAASLILSVISFIDYLQNNRKISLLASGIGAGLCWLSKLVGIVSGLMILGVAVFYWWWNYRKDWRKASLVFRDLALWLIVAFVVFVALWPMMWVEPIDTLVAYFRQSFLMSQDINSPMFFNGELNPEGEFGLDYFYYYPIVLFNLTTPLVLLGLISGAAAYFWDRVKKERPAETNFPLAGLFIALVIYLTIMTLSSKKAERYVVSAFLLLDLLAGMGYWLLLKQLKRVFPNARSYMAAVLVSLVVGSQALLVWQISPYYHSYYNPLWGNADRYFEWNPVGWGEGLDQAARYLNSKEAMDKKVVYVWYSATFDLFYDHRSKELSIPPSELDAQFEEIIAADYAIIYISQWQRQPNTTLIQYLADKQPEYVVEINGFEYVKVYNMADLRAQTVE
jgi:hypothetical protein